MPPPARQDGTRDSPHRWGRRCALLRRCCAHHRQRAARRSRCTARRRRTARESRRPRDDGQDRSAAIGTRKRTSAFPPIASARTGTARLTSRRAGTSLAIVQPLLPAVRNDGTAWCAIALSAASRGGRIAAGSSGRHAKVSSVSPRKAASTASQVAGDGPRSAAMRSLEHFRVDAREPRKRRRKSTDIELHLHVDEVLRVLSETPRDRGLRRRERNAAIDARRRPQPVSHASPRFPAPWASSAKVGIDPPRREPDAHRARARARPQPARNCNSPPSSLRVSTRLGRSVRSNHRLQARRQPIPDGGVAVVGVGVARACKYQHQESRRADALPTSSVAASCPPDVAVPCPSCQLVRAPSPFAYRSVTR